jgi:hypothetical protein
MSVDEMIDIIESGLDPNGETAKAVIAALKAGQAMRDKFNVFYDARDDFYFATSVDFIGLGESGKSWDAAATKEDV